MAKDKPAGAAGEPVRRRGMARRRVITSPQAREEERRQSFEKRERQQRWAYVLMGSGALVAFQHWLEHLDVISPPMDPTLQDFLIGYPTGGLLIVLGMIKLPA